MAVCSFADRCAFQTENEILANEEANDIVNFGSLLFAPFCKHETGSWQQSCGSCNCSDFHLVLISKTDLKRCKTLDTTILSPLSCLRQTFYCWTKDKIVFNRQTNMWLATALFAMICGWECIVCRGCFKQNVTIDILTTSTHITQWRFRVQAQLQTAQHGHLYQGTTNQTWIRTWNNHENRLVKGICWDCFSPPKHAIAIRVRTAISVTSSHWPRRYIWKRF